MPAAAPPCPTDTRSCDVVHSAALTALAVGDAATLGVTDELTLGVAVGLKLGVNVGLGGVGDCEVPTAAGGDAAGVPEPPVQPLIATTELSAQIRTSRRTRRA